MPSTVRRALTGAVLAVVLLAGCSSGPSAQQWATQVCAALAPWRAAITELNRQASEQMAAATTVAQTRTNLIALVDGARDASETARAGVVAAGVPDVDGGAEVAQRFQAALTATRDAYAAAAAELSALSVDDETRFYDGVVEVLGRLTTRYQQAGEELAGLSSTEVRAAFDAIPECR